MPQVISANSSPRCMRGEIRAHQQRRLDHADEDMHRRAERQRRRRCPSTRRSSQANAAVMRCRTPQWNSSEASALIVSTSGSAWKARMKLAPGWVSANGSGGRRRDSRTRSCVPASVAVCSAVARVVQPEHRRDRPAGMPSSSSAKHDLQARRRRRRCARECGAGPRCSSEGEQQQGDEAQTGRSIAVASAPAAARWLNGIVGGEFADRVHIHFHHARPLDAPAPWPPSRRRYRRCCDLEERDAGQRRQMSQIGSLQVGVEAAALLRWRPGCA